MPSRSPVYPDQVTIRPVKRAHSSHISPGTQPCGIISGGAFVTGTGTPTPGLAGGAFGSTGGGGAFGSGAGGGGGLQGRMD